MSFVRILAPLFLFCAATAASAEPVMLIMGTEIQLETVEPLSTRTHVKGDLVKLKTVGDVLVGTKTVVPSGTEAAGQIIEARAKGAMGMNGKLVLRPLYLQLGDITVRLTGTQGTKASVTAGAVIGMVALTTPVFTGRTAQMPAGTRFAAMVERSIQVGH